MTPKHVEASLAFSGSALFTLVVFDPQGLKDLRATLDRGMNTWEPQEQPKWLQTLSDRVDLALRAMGAA